MLQYINVLNQHIVHLKLMQHYMMIIHLLKYSHVQLKIGLAAVQRVDCSEEKLERRR